MYTLPPLSYSYDALEPFIDARTMELHHTKHHQIYIDKLNAALAPMPELAAKSVEELVRDLATLPESVRAAVRNFGGGHANHTMFWMVMRPNDGGEPSSALADAIATKFGDVQKFRDEFSKIATSVFGSGWAWLVRQPDGTLAITKTANQDSPLSDGVTPLLGLDVWEHAYYLQYQHKRADYINAWWNVVNWHAVEQRFEQ